jgi:hypothetical protein
VRRDADDACALGGRARRCGAPPGLTQRRARRQVLGQHVWPNPVVGQTYRGELARLRLWIADRAAWLDANMPPAEGCGSG